MKKASVVVLTVLLFGLSAIWAQGSGETTEQKPIVLRYAHANAVSSIANQQAEKFADLVKEKTNGELEIQVYPSGQLGGLQEQTESVANGSIAFCHNSMAGLSALYQPLEALDTPFLYRDVDHLMKTVDPDSSPVMQEMNKEMTEQSGVRLLYSIYFGSRELTCNKAIYSPADLKGVKIRAISSPIYISAVEGMGAIAIPLDWSEVPTALATGVIDGQENPVNTILNNKLADVQKYIMMTNHIMNATGVVMNESVFEGLTESQQKAVKEAAREASKWATDTLIANESSDLEKLRQAGMTVIDTSEGLDLEAMKTSVDKKVSEGFGSTYADLYKEIAAVR